MNDYKQIEKPMQEAQEKLDKARAAALDKGAETLSGVIRLMDSWIMVFVNRKHIVRILKEIEDALSELARGYRK